MRAAARRLLALALLVACLSALSGAEAGRARVDFLTLAEALSLGAPPLALARLGSAASSASSSLAAGEAALLEGALAEPLILLELPRIPTELLARVTIDRLGPIVGPRTSEVPDDVAFAAIALGDGPIPAEALISSSLRASVRQESPAEQREDLAALLGER